ncbi:hypothetical protein BKP37_12360 [Anaerobacillus alkalilacustris]|uniref:LysM domain-containing protein n=1 Tax=Anaerobacillus alkalilacustris TaxID=393763 RepID=A0A1S2LPE1_9BACI|nr:CAP domain-containing protein [Anaerobacillus alkalilacustris]OIJ13285.1 hypothetical protein BKP37_12360 [Anaerobacillus alkalilacustris]
MKRKNGVVFVVFVLFFFIFIPSDSFAEGNTKTYIVQPGNSLWNISLLFDVGLTELLELNPQISNPNLIYPNQRLKIPYYDQIKKIEHKVIELTNQERAKFGLAPLKPNLELSQVARNKSNDMRDNDYFSHVSPTYGSPFDMIRDFGITFDGGAENIAQGQTTPDVVLKSWMNSPGHRQNILNKKMTTIGVGYAKGGTGRHYWTQMFIQ